MAALEPPPAHGYLVHLLLTSSPLLLVQVTAGVCRCEVCDQHNQREQESLSGASAAPGLPRAGRTSNTNVPPTRSRAREGWWPRGASLSRPRLIFDVTPQEPEIFSSLSAARSLLEQQHQRPLLLLQESALEDFSGGFQEPFNIRSSKLPPSLTTGLLCVKAWTRQNRTPWWWGWLRTTSTIRRSTRPSGDPLLPSEGSCSDH